jgi:UDP-2-acetamido-2-deoxy-ribo-hexuluronate aminotransferase
VKVEFIDLKKQYELIKSAIDGRLHQVLDHGQFIMGPEVKELEEKLAAFTGSRHAIACASGTDALLIALMALGIGPEDEVITTPFSFIATAEVISVLRATPVFVDIDPRTYNLDPARIEAAITPKTKAIIAVSLYGQCADLDALEAIAARHSVTVIEDAAQSFGATYKGRRSCNLSTIGCTSFFPSKPLGCYGDGGACFTNDADLTAKMKQIRVHGQDRRYHHPIIGINGRIDTLQAAVLLAKFDSFPHEVKARAQAGERYDRLLAGAVVTPYVEPRNTAVYAQYTVQVDDREKVQAELKQKGIPTAVHYPVPLHLQPAFAALGHREGDFPVAEAAAKRVLSLPMHPYISEAEQNLVADAVLEATTLKASTALAR